jgi:hypothetical protein
MGRGAAIAVDTPNFMSPELLVPSKFGMDKSLPTPEADIYAFGFAIFQVFERDYGLGLLLKLSRSLQVKLHSMGFEEQNYYSLWSRGCVQLNPGMLQL